MLFLNSFFNSKFFDKINPFFLEKYLKYLNVFCANRYEGATTN